MNKLAGYRNVDRTKRNIFITDEVECHSQYDKKYNDDQHVYSNNNKIINNYSATNFTIVTHTYLHFLTEVSLFIELVVL